MPSGPPARRFAVEVGDGSTVDQGLHLKNSPRKAQRGGRCQLQPQIATRQRELVGVKSTTWIACVVKAASAKADAAHGRHVAETLLKFVIPRDTHAEDVISKR